MKSRKHTRDNSFQSPSQLYQTASPILQQDNAISNYGYEGYQPPLTFIDPAKIVSQGLVPENLKNIVITEDDFGLGIPELEITPQANQMWESIYQQVTGGA